MFHGLKWTLALSENVPNESLMLNNIPGAERNPITIAAGDAGSAAVSSPGGLLRGGSSRLWEGRPVRSPVLKQHQ